MRLSIGKGLLLALSWLGVCTAAAQSPVQQIQLVAASPLAGLGWQKLASDPQGDVLHPRLPEVKELAYAFDSKAGRVWFKVGTYEALPERWVGVNVAIDDDGNPDNGMAWWGTNKVKFDRLVSAYLFKAESYWQGVAGVADADAAGRNVLNNLSRDVQVALDREQRAILVGVPRSALGKGRMLRISATVGSMVVNNDDVPNEGTLAITLKN